MKNKLLLLFSMFVVFMPSVALADTASVGQTPNISQGQGLTESPSDNAKSNADEAADRVSKSAIESKNSMKDQTSNNTGKVVNNITDQVVTGAKDAAGNPTDSTGLDIMNVFSKVDQFADSVGGKSIAILVKIFYYSSFIGFILCSIFAVVAIFRTKGKPSRWILAAIGCFATFYFITSFLGVNITNNPFTELFSWLFN